jgi:hypothetical protein
MPGGPAISKCMFTTMMIVRVRERPVDPIAVVVAVEGPLNDAIVVLRPVVDAVAMSFFVRLSAEFLCRCVEGNSTSWARTRLYFRRLKEFRWITNWTGEGGCERQINGGVT